jgi:hypothetical protein
MMGQSETLREQSDQIYYTLFCAFHQSPQAVYFCWTKTIFLSQTGVFWFFFIQFYCAGSHTKSSAGDSITTIHINTPSEHSSKPTPKCSQKHLVKSPQNELKNSSQKRPVNIPQNLAPNEKNTKFFFWSLSLRTDGESQQRNILKTLGSACEGRKEERKGQGTWETTE